MFDALDAGLLNIIITTMKVTLPSSAISAVLGTALGLLLEGSQFYGKRIIVRINRTLMGSPPVVVGLVCYLLFMRKGVFGFMDILFSVKAMVVAQVMIITPIISGMVYSSAERNAPNIRSFAHTMGASAGQTRLLLIKELKNEVYFAAISGFGRAISEVGAVMIVGGNIRGKTRTMTTAITLLRNQGNYSEAIYLGCVLMAIALCVQLVADNLKGKEAVGDDNY
ncbi:MAG: ABC transporter permease [Eubacteriaceae bacterium]|nr:ABC transporter permease [Eubacteriaceae bacterium]